MRKKDVGLGIFFVLFGAWVYAIAAQLRSGPDFWPKIVAVCISVMGVAIMLNGIFHITESNKRQNTEPKETGVEIQNNIRVVLLVAILIVFFYLFQLIGYMISTFLLFCGTSFVLGYRNWKVLIPTAVCLSVGLYMFFVNLLGVRFPGTIF